MDENLKREMEEQRKKIDEIHNTILHLKRYFVVSLVVKILIIILPVLGIIWSIPRLVEFYEQFIDGFGV